MKNILLSVLRSIKKRDLHYKIFCSVLIATGFSNFYLQALEVRYKKFLYIKKKYGQTLVACDDGGIYSLNMSSQKVEKGYEHVWICWLQGWEEGVPELVKRCCATVQLHMVEKKIHLISEENMYDYVEFPEYVIKKWKAGFISNAHFSDLLRTELLLKYGGLWLDATVLLTGRVPDFIYTQDLFMYQYNNEHDVTLTCNNWLILAAKGHRVLRSIRYFLYSYWRYENTAREYFLWHQAATLAFQRFPEDLRNMYYIPNAVPHMLAVNIFRKFDTVYWNALIEMTTVHKLSNKFEIPEDIADTYYDFVIKKEYVCKHDVYEMKK